MFTYPCWRLEGNQKLYAAVVKGTCYGLHNNGGKSHIERIYVREWDEGCTIGYVTMSKEHP